MGNRRSIKEQTSTKHETDNPETWNREPATVRTVDPEDAELDELFSDFPQNEACIEIYRVNSQGGRPMFLEQVAPVTFSMAYVTENYGGGRFIAKGKYKDGSKVRMPFEIEGDPIPVKRKIPQGGPVVTSLPGAAPQAIERVIEQAGNGSQGELVAVLAGMMQTMMRELKTSETAMLEKMKMYKELFGGAPAGPQAPFDQAIAMLKQGIELGSAAGAGDGSGGNFWLLALDKLKDPLTQLMSTIQTAVVASRTTNITPGKPAALPPGATVPAPALAVPAQPSPYSEPVNGNVTNNEDPMLAMVKMVMPALINGAAKNAEPGFYVEYILDQLPESAYDPLRNFLLTPDCLDKLALIEPGIRFQQEWWVSLRGGLLGALNEELGNGVRPIQPSSASNPTTGAPPDSSDIS